MSNEIQREIYKRMNPFEKLKVSMDMYWTARKYKAAYLRQLHPDWTEEQVQDKVREIFLYASS